MKQFFSNWVFWKHFIFCFVIWLFIVAVTGTPHEASSIGIIGGADGPTSIFIAGKLYPYLLKGLLFIVALAFYVPLKNIFKRVFV